MNTVLFDLDGTLLNTLPDLHSSTNYALEKFGFPQRTQEEVRNFIGNGLKNLILKAVPDGAPEAEAVLAEMKRHYAVHCHDATRVYDGVLEMLQYLQERGCRMAIVSNKADPMVQTLKTVYFDGLIPVAVGETEGVQRKPASDMVHLALERLGCSLDGACYVGDSEVDLLTAENAGLPCFPVGWGFRTEAQLRAAGAKQVYPSPAALCRALEYYFRCRSFW